MIEVPRPYRANNTEMLDQRLREIFGERYLSMDSSDAGIIFRFKQRQVGDDDLLDAELANHNPIQKTKRQEKAADKGNAFGRLRTLDMDALRAKVSKVNQRDELLSDILNILEDLQKQLLED